MSDLAKLRKTLGLSQQATADRASITKSIISEVEGRHKGLSVAASLKAAPVLQVHPGVLYLGTQLAAVKAKLEEEEITEDAAADKLLRILRTVLEKFEDLESEEEAEALIDQLEELLAETTGKTVENVKGSKPAAGAATKGMNDLIPGLDGVLKYALKSGYDPGDFDVEDGRDLHGKKLRPTPDEDGDDDYPADAGDGDGRDAFGRRTSPFNGRGR